MVLNGNDISFSEGFANLLFFFNDNYATHSGLCILEMKSKGEEFMG